MNQVAAVDTTNDVEDALSQESVDEFKKKSVSGAVSYTVRSLFLFGIGFLTTLFLAGYLTAEEFGIFGFITQIVGLLQFFSSIGLGATLIQKKTEPTVEEYRSVFTVQQMLAWLLFFIVLAIVSSGLLTAKIGMSGIWVLLALSFSLPLDSLRVIPAIILERKLEFSKLVLPNIVEQITYNAVLLVCAVFLHQGVMSYAYAIILRGLFGVAAMYSIQRWSFGLSFNKTIIRSFLSTGLQFQLSDFLARVKDNLFYLALGAFLPLKEFGYITWAKSWSQMPYNLTVLNVIAITFPAYSRLQHDKALLKRAIEKTMYFISVSAFPMLAVMAIFIVPFTQVIVRYQKWQPALLTFALFTLSIGWAAISTPLTNTLSAIGQVHKTVQLMIMWTILTWILTPLCIWLWGFNGVAAAAFIISFTSVMPIIFVRKYVQIDIITQTKDAFFATVGMSIVSIAGLAFWKMSLLHVFGGMVLAGFVYFALLLMIGRQKFQLEIASLLHKKR